ncbi:hypothetical protein [Paenibacillus alginolyticus]|nr:hypothetical protein [Paenibacillus alginolyticus]
MSVNEQVKVTPGHIEVLPIAGRIGAEIKGRHGLGEYGCRI